MSGAEREPLATVLLAIANDERRALLIAMRDLPDTGAGATISELAEATGVSRFVASHHLAVLRVAGLATEQASGRKRLHRVNQEGLLLVDDWLSPFLIDVSQSSPWATLVSRA